MLATGLLSSNTTFSSQQHLISLNKARGSHEMPPLWPYDSEHGGFLKHKSAFKSRTGSVGLSSKLKVQKIIWSDKNYILLLASHQNTALVIVYCVPRVPK